MRRILSEKNLVVVLFVMVLVIFALAQEDTRKIERMYQSSGLSATSSLDEALHAEAATKSKELPEIQAR